MAAGWLVVWGERQNAWVLFCSFHAFALVLRLCVMLFEFSVFARLCCWLRVELFGRTEAGRLSHVMMGWLRGR